MKARHTPEPWRADLEDRLLRDGIQITGHEGKRIAYVQPDDTMEIENGIIVECCSAVQKRNAALIKAAPTMYEALIFAEAALSGVPAVLKLGREHAEAFERARDLVRRALKTAQP